MIFRKPRSEKDAKEQHRQAYEYEKQDLIEIHKELGYEESTLKQFIVNSLKNDYKLELKEDGLI